MAATTLQLIWCVLQCVAVCCSVLQCVLFWATILARMCVSTIWCMAATDSMCGCNMLQPHIEHKYGCNRLYVWLQHVAATHRAQIITYYMIYGSDLWRQRPNTRLQLMRFMSATDSMCGCNILYDIWIWFVATTILYMATIDAIYVCNRLYVWLQHIIWYMDLICGYNGPIYGYKCCVCVFVCMLQPHIESVAAIHRVCCSHI